jgi:cell division protein ZapA (FtsZ GTPase activity inhibitor)
MEFKSASELSDNISNMIKSVMAMVGVVTMDDFKDLEKRVADIEAKLSKAPAKKKPGRPPKSKTAKKASKQPKA